MATMTRWDPFQDLRSAQDEMAQMSPMLAHALGLHAQQGSGRATPMAWAPALDISERKDAYLVTVELPGVDVDDLQITLEDGLLTIQGERYFAHDSSEQHFHRVERHYGAFRRSITLPAHCDGGGHRGHGRQRRAPDPGAQDGGGHSQAHPGTPRPGGGPCGKQE